MGTSFSHGEASLFTLTTPLGEDKLLLRGFKGSEGISRLFRFELDLLSEDPSIDYTQIIGKGVTLSLRQADGTFRYLSGVISRFGQGGMEDPFTSYHAEMVPWLWFLTRTADCRIFQNMTIPDIIKQIFTGLGFNEFSDSLNSTYTARDYCVQYRETDFNFVSRLMEEYGIFYFFQHEQDKHTLVLGDDPSANANCPGQDAFRLYFEATANLDEDVVNGWHTEQELRTGKSTLADYNFITPSTSLLVTTATTDNVGGNSKFDTYDYPGKYLNKDDGQDLTKIRMQEEEAMYSVVSGTSNARSMVSGYKFTLTEHYRDDLNTSYLLTEIEHDAHTTSYGTSQGTKEHYSNSFKCIPASVPFRPPRVTPRPTVQGPQPAVVVGPSGEEIYTDQYGRVKVQFFWDRLGTNDQNSSCWMRVSQLFAGKGWGAMFLPRIGQEVIVDFLEGDPDQPLITGRVYNADQTTPGTLPDKMNVSGWRTHSTQGGGEHDANVLAFDDTEGSEVFYMRAEKDMAVRVENNEDTHIMNNQTITVDNDRTETVTNGNETVEIKQGNRSHKVTMGNETLTVAQGNRSVEVSMGNDDHKIDMGNRSATISMGNDSVTISMGNQTTTVSMGSISTTAMQSITLTVGANSITIDPSGVTISGIMVNINGTAMISSSAPMISESADGMLQLQGAITMIN